MRRQCWLLAICWLCGLPPALAVAVPPPQVDIVVQEGDYLITTPIYKARVNADGNLHSLSVNGIEFLNDRVAGSTGASFFTERPVMLPNIRQDERKLIATDGTYTITYEFDEGFITLTLQQNSARGAAFITVHSPQIDYVENLSQAGIAAVPADYDWPAVVLTVPSGEYLELRGGSRVWGRELGRQVWELSDIAPKKRYTVMMIPGRRIPRTPDLSQLTTLTATSNAPDYLAPAGQTIDVQVRFTNNANQPIKSEIALFVKSSQGKVLLDDRKPLTCDSHKSVSLTWTLAPADADFYTATCTVPLKGTAKKQTTTFGYNVTAIAPAVERPADFDDYWTKLTTDAAAVKMALTRLEDRVRSTGTVTVYRLTLTAGETVCYGWLAVPRFPGRYPGLLLLPGDRVRYITPNAALADCGFVVMTLEPTGQTVDGALKPLITRASSNLADANTVGLRAIFISYLRAVCALATVPEVDPNRLAVTGVGLGGGMALILGALDERVQAVAPDVPYYCFIEWNRTAPGWPYWEVADYLRAHSDQEAVVLRTLRYYDAANFTDRVTCPVLISAGIDDTYSRPANIFGLYNRLTGPRAIKVYPAGHEGGGLQHWEEKIRWLGQVLGSPSPLPATAESGKP